MLFLLFCTCRLLKRPTGAASLPHVQGAAYHFHDGAAAAFPRLPAPPALEAVTELGSPVQPAAHAPLLTRLSAALMSRTAWTGGTCRCGCSRA